MGANKLCSCLRIEADVIPDHHNNAHNHILKWAYNSTEIFWAENDTVTIITIVYSIYIWKKSKLQMELGWRVKLDEC